MSARPLGLVSSPGPAQPDLPYPPPPDRPFVALARDAQIGGGPVRKWVYVALATYCPLMAQEWIARGYPRRETLLRVCEIVKLDTLDGHLRALRDAGWIDWRKGRRASEFEVRLAAPPLREVAKTPHLRGSLEVLDSPSNGVSKPCAEESRHPISGNKTPHLRDLDSPSNGVHKCFEESEDCTKQSSDQNKTPAAPATAPPAGATEKQVWALVRLAGKFRAVSDEAAYARLTKKEGGEWIERLNSRLPLPKDHRHEPAERAGDVDRCMCGVVLFNGGDWTLLPARNLPATWEAISTSLAPRPGSVEDRRIREARRNDNRPARCPDCSHAICPGDCDDCQGCTHN